MLSCMIASLISVACASQKGLLDQPGGVQKDPKQGICWPAVNAADLQNPGAGAAILTNCGVGKVECTEASHQVICLAVCAAGLQNPEAGAAHGRCRQAQHSQAAQPAA